MPAVPIAIIVKNGPSFKESMEIAPASVSSPYCCARPKYNPPAELVIPAIIAIEVIPINPASPQNFATRRPSPTPKINFISVSVHPLYNGIPIFLISMDAPFSKRNIPRRHDVPVLNIPEVKPPIPSTLGINVFASTPINIGTIINPPGTFCMSLKKLFSSFILCRSFLFGYWILDTIYCTFIIHFDFTFVNLTIYLIFALYFCALLLFLSICANCISY